MAKLGEDIGYPGFKSKIKAPTKASEAAEPGKDPDDDTAEIEARKREYESEGPDSDSLRKSYEAQKARMSQGYDQKSMSGVPAHPGHPGDAGDTGQ